MHRSRGWELFSPSAMNTPEPILSPQHIIAPSNGMSWNTSKKPCQLILRPRGLLVTRPLSPQLSVLSSSNGFTRVPAQVIQGSHAPFHWSKAVWDTAHVQLRQAIRRQKVNAD
ncbi:uncharacterized protein AB9W97_007380 [Spinachia spinachia]